MRRRGGSRRENGEGTERCQERDGIRVHSLECGRGTALDKSGRPGSSEDMEDWQAWLKTWNRELLARYDPNERSAFLDPRVTPETIASGWLGAPGASEPQLAALEARLGTRLPPSYRTFLRVSNGFLQPGVVVPRLLPTEEVGWVREREPEIVATWTEGLTPGPDACDAGGFERDLASALQVSARETVGTAMYLLNPRVVSAAGEWEAWYFAHWVPGIHRFPSFEALMQSELESLRAPTPPPPPGRLRTFVNVVRWILRGPARKSA